MRFSFDAETQRRGDKRRIFNFGSALISTPLRLCVKEKASFGHATLS
jgi:hypothetical protein